MGQSDSFSEQINFSRNFGPNLVAALVLQGDPRPCSGTSRNRPWDKLGPVPGTSRPFSVEFHRQIGIL